MLRRGAPRKLAFNPIDRLIFIGLYRLFPQTCIEIGQTSVAKYQVYGAEEGTSVTRMEGFPS